MVYSIANVMIQTNINALGSNAVAGSSAALNYEYFAFFFLQAFSQSAVTFVGQNYGAGNLERCKKVSRYAILLGTMSTTIISFIFIAFEQPLISLFTSEIEAAQNAYIRMNIILSWEFFNAYVDNVSGVLRGYGRSTAPAIVCIVGICGVRIGYIYTFYQKIRTLAGLMYAYPISWLVTPVVITIVYFTTMKQIRGAR